MNKKLLKTFILFTIIFFSKANSSEFDVKAKTVIIQDYL